MLDLVPEKYKYPISDLLSESVWCGLVRITELEFASLEFVRTSETGERTTKRLSTEASQLQASGSSNFNSCEPSINVVLWTAK